MIRRRLAAFISLLVMVGMLLGSVACASGTASGSGTQATPTPIPTSIVPTNPTYDVQRGDVVLEMEFQGRVAPIREQTLFFRTNGYVDGVYVARGDEVQEGDVLAELEVTDLRNQITQREAELLAVQMDYDRRMTEAQNSLRAAELRLAKLLASNSDTQITGSRINLERARTRLAHAQDEYNKSLDRSWERPEVREGYANAVQEAQWNLEMAEAQYQDAINARQRNVYDVELAEMDLDMAQLRMSEIEAGLDVTRTQLSLNRLLDQLSDARIVAPFDGIILQISLMEGRQIQGYNTMMIIADPSELEVSADLTDSEKSQLSEGMEVIAEFVNRPGDHMSGAIRRMPYPYGGGGRIAGVQDEDTSVRITLEGMDERVSTSNIGDRLRMTVELDRAEDALWLPPQAVRSFEGRSFVVIQEDGGQRRVDVRVGIRARDRIEILDGLSEGQSVLAP